MARISEKRCKVAWVWMDKNLKNSSESDHPLALAYFRVNGSIGALLSDGVVFNAKIEKLALSYRDALLLEILKVVKSEPKNG